MRGAILLAAMAGALLVAAPVQARPLEQAPAAVPDWSTTVEATPAGGFRMGNPNAPVKLVEFVSLTCPHCASFAEEGVPQLMDEVRAGRISLEYRNFVLDELDMAAALISRCAAPEDYFALNHAILVSQREWVGRIETLSDAQMDELRAMETVRLVPALIPLTGLDALAADHGVDAEEARACLADNLGFLRILAMRDSAEADLGVNATPSFLINGRLQRNVHDWAALEPLLRAAATARPGGEEMRRRGPSCR